MGDHSMEGHTLRRFDSELSQLHLRVLEMGGLVQHQLIESLRALRGSDVERARKITRTDRKIDSLESDVDEKVIALAARRAPMGRDLRMVLVVSKSVTELEEVGDEVVNIAEKTIQLCRIEGVPPNPKFIHELDSLASQAVEMMATVMRAYDLLEECAAENVIANHRSLEMNFQSELRRLVSLEVYDAQVLSQIVDIALIAKSLEAIGQHTKKIAEYVIFYIRGEDVRHNS